jgi:hypothetical protein
MGGPSGAAGLSLPLPGLSGAAGLILLLPGVITFGAASGLKLPLSPSVATAAGLVLPLLVGIRVLLVALLNVQLPSFPGLLPHGLSLGLVFVTVPISLTECLFPGFIRGVMLFLSVTPPHFVVLLPIVHRQILE